MDKFNFYGLSFRDRHTYGKYKEIKKHADYKSSTYTMKFTKREEHTLRQLQEQFMIEGYNTSNTCSYPIRQYCKELQREDDFIYLEVGTSSTVRK